MVLTSVDFSNKDTNHNLLRNWTFPTLLYAILQPRTENSRLTICRVIRSGTEDVSYLYSEKSYDIKHTVVIVNLFVYIYRIDERVSTSIMDYDRVLLNLIRPGDENISGHYIGVWSSIF